MTLKSRGAHKKAIVPKTEYDPNQDSVAVTTLQSFAFTFPDEPPYEISVAEFHNAELAAEMLASLARRYEIEHLRRSSVRALVKTIRMFCEHLPNGMTSILDITEKHINNFENHLAREYPSSRTGLTYYVGMNSLLKEAATVMPVTEEVKYCLMRSSGILSTDYQPYSAYEISTMETIINAAVEDMNETLKRFPPQTFINAETENIVNSLRAGKSLPDNARERKELSAHTGAVARIPNIIYPSLNDLVPFIVALSATSGINPGSLLNLDRDCIVVQTKKSVGVKIFKARRGANAHDIVYLKDGGVRTPGGIIKAVLKITEELAERYDTKKLWAYYDYRKGVLFHKDSLNRKYALDIFVSNHNLVNPDGSPLDLQLVRLRKTVKLDEYKETRGVPSLMKGHSANVAAQHYANLPQTIQTHLDALLGAMQNVVELPANVRADDTPSDRSAVSRCKNMYDSPFFETGKLCSAIPGMCFACPNAVLTLDSLPAILSYVDYLIDSATRLSPEAWLDSFSTTWIRIHESILPQFTPKEIEIAEIEKTSAKIPFSTLEIRL